MIDIGALYAGSLATRRCAGLQRVRVLVWQWGRRGAGPRYAAELARSFAAQRGTVALLSLSTGAELLRIREPPHCHLPVGTYRGLPTYCCRLLAAPVLVFGLVAWLRRERIDVALCAMPAPMDLVMALALRVAAIPFGVVVHEAELHPGDRFPAQFWLQRQLLRYASLAFALSAHVDGRIRSHRLAHGKPVVRTHLPPFQFGARSAPAPAAGRPLHLLYFGRLLAYKGLDLLADSLHLLGPRPDLRVRVVGSGPESATLHRLRALPGVSVENRWVAEEEIVGLVEWADAFVLPYREASQSGVAATAVAARRWIVATNVGGLPEQLGGEALAILCEPTAASLAGALARLCEVDRAGLPPDGPAERAWGPAAGAMLAALSAVATAPPDLVGSS